MHRTTCPRQSLWLGVLAALLLAVLPSRGWAQAAPGSAIIVPINGTVRLQMSTKKPIKTISNPKEQAISIRTVVGDPTTVLITGQMPDVTRIEMTDEDGKKESYEVIVQLDVEYLRTQLKRAVPTANITVIPSSNNTVILQGYVNKAEDIDIIMRVAQSIGGVTVVNAMRVGGVQQVQLDIVIAQVARTEFRRMSFNFLSDSTNTFFGSTVGQATTNPALVGATSAFLNATSINGQVLSGAPGAPNGAPTNFLAGVLHNNYGFLFFLQALRDENLAKLLAEPRLVTMSGRPASFLVGGEQAVPVPAGLGQVGVQFEEFGTRLNFLPIVLGNGRIHLEVEPEVSNLDPTAGTIIQGTVVPGRVTNRINTTVEVETGQTVVIGGLIQRQIVANISRVPVLGDIPFLNTAFSSKGYQEIEQEVVVMVTPYLIDPQSCDQVVKYLPGQETRSPDDFELFLEGILEAPRGPRQVCQGHMYVPAYKNSPSVALYPCAGRNANGTGGCADGSCYNGTSNGIGTGAYEVGGLPVTPSAPGMLPTPKPLAPLAPAKPMLPPTGARQAPVTGTISQVSPAATQPPIPEPPAPSAAAPVAETPMAAAPFAQPAAETPKPAALPGSLTEPEKPGSSDE